MPLQLERRGQTIDAFIQELHHAVVGAINVDFANPERTRRFNSNHSVGRSDPGAAHPSKTFPHPLEKPRPIMLPLIAIVFANKLGNTLPISAVNCAKEMLCMEAYLMLGSPKPEQIYADAQCYGQHADDCFTKRNRHTRCNDTTSGSNPRRIRPTGIEKLTGGRKSRTCSLISTTQGNGRLGTPLRLRTQWFVPVRKRRPQCIAHRGPSALRDSGA
jgi:hypothetical protein